MLAPSVPPEEIRLSAEQDRADVRRVRNGDTEAFAGIVNRWQGPLLNLAYRFCRDRGVAEELAQEAFLRIFRKLHLYREEALFSTWMFTVATRLFTSHARRFTPKFARVDLTETLPGGDNPSADSDRRDRDEAVRRAVNTLPDRYRDAIVLFYFMDRDLLDTAAALGVSEGTVKSRLHRGRKMLERKITEG